MCDPVTIAVASTVAAMASTGVAAYSQIQQANHKAAVADMNRSAQELAARDAIERGRADAERLGREQAIAKGQQRAAMAANGVDVDFGTAAAVQKDTDLIQGEDRAALQRNIFNEVRGYDMNAANFGNEASAARASKAGIAIGAGLSIASEGLAGVQQYKGIRADKKAGRSGWNVPRRR